MLLESGAPHGSVPSPLRLAARCDCPVGTHEDEPPPRSHGARLAWGSAGQGDRPVGLSGQHLLHAQAAWEEASPESRVSIDLFIVKCYKYRTASTLHPSRCGAHTHCPIHTHRAQLPAQAEPEPSTRGAVPGAGQGMGQGCRAASRAQPPLPSLVCLVPSCAQTQLLQNHPGASDVGQGQGRQGWAGLCRPHRLNRGRSRPRGAMAPAPGH